MSLVRLHRDPIVHGSHVLALPAWLPPSGHPNASYWHMPRSASLRADGTLHVNLWCGPFRNYDAATFAATSDPPDELRCGTCVGRRAGYDRENGMIFAPRDHWALPKVCPSTTPDPADLRLCLACGRRTNAARGFNSYGLAFHAPDAALADRFSPCPRHGWERMWVRDDTLVCTAFRCGDGGAGERW